MRIWRGAAATVLLFLTACTSLSLDTAAKFRALDILNDDIANLVLAVDVPLTLEPTPEASLLSVKITTPASGERHVEAALVRADAGEIVGRLPVPAPDRTYYLFGFSDADKARLREAQTWAKTLPPGQTLAITLAPRFCRNAEIDPKQTRVSVLIALPGTTGLAPLINAESIETLLASSGATSLPVCAGHSG